MNKKKSPAAKTTGLDGVTTTHWTYESRGTVSHRSVLAHFLRSCKYNTTATNATVKIKAIATIVIYSFKLCSKYLLPNLMNMKKPTIPPM